MSSTGTWFFKRRALAFGIMAAGSSLGGVILPIMVDRIIARAGFPWAMRGAAFLLLALLIYANLTVRSRLPPSPKPWSLMEFVLPFRELTFSLVVFASFLFFAGMFLPFTFVILSAQHDGMSERLAAYLVPILNAGKSPHCRLISTSPIFFFPPGIQKQSRTPLKIKIQKTRFLTNNQSLHLRPHHPGLHRRQIRPLQHHDYNMHSLHPPRLMPVAPGPRQHPLHPLRGLLRIQQRRLRLPRPRPRGPDLGYPPDRRADGFHVRGRQCGGPDGESDRRGAREQRGRRLLGAAGLLRRDDGGGQFGVCGFAVESGRVGVCQGVSDIFGGAGRGGEKGKHNRVCMKLERGVYVYVCLAHWVFEYDTPPLARFGAAGS